MIGSFLESWPLFHNAYLSGWLIAALLSLLGVLVVARDQIFVGAAISQASVLGVTVAMTMGSTTLLDHCDGCRSDWFFIFCGSLFAIAGALVTSLGSGEGRESHESVTGWVFLVGSSLSVLLVAQSPLGLAEVHRLLASTIIGATGTDLGVFAVLTAATAACLWVLHRPVMLLAMDPEMAAAVGIRVGAWNKTISIWLGLAVGLSIHVSGVTYTFGALVLPALVAKNVCREVRTMFVVAPLTAVITAALAFAVANDRDFPPAHVAVALWSLLLVLAWAAKWALRRRVAE